ncbi:MAG: GFA family protein [Planctomycetota bacterium]
MSESTTAGACLCGAVRYTLHGEIRGFQYCHCSRCRKFTGSAHAANVFVKPDQLQWLQGEDSLGTFTKAGQPPFPTAFCTGCGSSMPSMSSTGRFWVVPAGGLDDDPELRPARSIFWESRAPWYEDVSALPKHDELPT